MHACIHSAGYHGERWRQRHFSYFKSLGIPGPEPNLLWGNIREYHSTHHHKVIEKWLEKYGDTFGFYDGDVPFVVTLDLDFLEYVLVRNFQNFTDRGDELLTEQKHPLLRNSIVYAAGTQWRNIRRCVASGFTPAKLKQMLTDMNRGADIYLDIAGEHADSGREANVYELYRKLSMDYVGRAAFGVDCSFQRGPDNVLATTTKVILQSVMTGPLHFLCQSTSALGIFATPLYWIHMILGAYAAITMTKETARGDRSQKKKSRKYEEESSETEYGTSANGKGPANVPKSRVLTKDEVLLNASTLFVAGHDTLSTSLSYVTYLLAKHQDIQNRVRKEINDATSSTEELDYETVTRKLPYLSQVVSEALRLYAPVLTFAPENEGSYHKVAYQAFGLGPRNCLGQRMGYVALNLTLARLVQQFHLELGPSQGEEPLDIDCRAVVSEPAVGPWIVFRRT
ncbi:hypothetical protein HPB51_016797 [Rhipicephalus microplus]|uniref:Cytochrome n=1 Tax=Rhipicephalus microplus TaxID=6941 RepID=A0A9J6DWC9_RHIMP|nr:hypothetical protein HPB51_016797 [Rhipicephalus microplus]